MKKAWQVFCVLMAIAFLVFAYPWSFVILGVMLGAKVVEWLMRRHRYHASISTRRRTAAEQLGTLVWEKNCNPQPNQEARQEGLLQKLM